MAKFYFYYGTMNCGKSRHMISVWYNYNSLGLSAYIMKPEIDTKGNNSVISRNGDSKEVDYLIKRTDDLYKKFKNMKKLPACILIDEAQFLSEDNVKQLSDVVDYLNIPVMCYGLLKDFRSKLFEGSKALVETVDKIEEIKTICKCGKKATDVIRYVDGRAMSKGRQIMIDNDSKVEYKAICRVCKKKEIGKE